MKFNLLIVLKIADIYLNLHYVVLINYQFLSKLLNYLLMFNLHFSEDPRTSPSQSAFNFLP